MKKMFKSLRAIVLLFGVAWAQKPADKGAQRPSADASKQSNAPLAELKTQTYKGTLMDASCAGASKGSSGGKAAAADQSQGCKVSASTKEFALRTDSSETLRFDSVGNTRAGEAIKNKKKWSSDAAAGKPIRAKVSANANGDKLTVMSINWRRIAPVTVSGSLAKDGSNLANARSVVLADGKRVFAASSENENKQQ